MGPVDSVALEVGIVRLIDLIIALHLDLISLRIPVFA